MNFLLPAIVFFFLFLWFMGFCIFCFFFWMIFRWFRRRRQSRALRLRSFHKRLKAVLAELLKQVNEIDQVSKYAGVHNDPVWAKKYSESLKRLLESGDKLNDAANFIEMKEYNAAQEMLLFVARVVHITHYRMPEIIPREDFSSLYKVAEDAACASDARSTGKDIDSAYRSSQASAVEQPGNFQTGGNIDDRSGTEKEPDHGAKIILPKPENQPE